MLLSCCQWGGEGDSELCWDSGLSISGCSSETDPFCFLFQGSGLKSQLSEEGSAVGTVSPGLDSPECKVSAVGGLRGDCEQAGGVLGCDALQR